MASSQMRLDDLASLSEQDLDELQWAGPLLKGKETFQLQLAHVWGMAAAASKHGWWSRWPVLAQRWQHQALWAEENLLFKHVGSETLATSFADMTAAGITTLPHTVGNSLFQDFLLHQAALGSSRIFNAAFWDVVAFRLGSSPPSQPEDTAMAENLAEDIIISAAAFAKNCASHFKNCKGSSARWSTKWLQDVQQRHAQAEKEREKQEKAEKEKVAQEKAEREKERAEREKAEKGQEKGEKEAAKAAKAEKEKRKAEKQQANAEKEEGPAEKLEEEEQEAAEDDADDKDDKGAQDEATPPDAKRPKPCLWAVGMTAILCAKKHNADYNGFKVLIEKVLSQECKVQLLEGPRQKESLKVAKSRLNPIAQVPEEPAAESAPIFSQAAASSAPAPEDELALIFEGLGE